MLILAPLEELLSGAKPSSPELRADLELMLRNAQRLLRHINTLLDLSRLDAKHEFLRLEEVDVLELIGSLVESGKPLAAQRHVMLALATESAPLPPFPVDRDKLEKIVLNLLSNAIRFTDGTEARPGAVTVRCGVRGDRFVCSVEDTGIGIPDDQNRARVRSVPPGAAPRVARTGRHRHRPRARAPARRVPHGLGHGAQPGRRGLLLHARAPDGSRRVPRRADRSAPGSTWRSRSIGGGRPSPPQVELHLEGARPPARPLRHTPAPATRALGKTKPLVLVVDDNRELLEFVSRQLADEFRVRVAERTEEALHAAAFETPALVVSDVMMPGRSGTDLLRDLRRDARLRHVPVILVTAKADLASKIENLAEGADEYLAKPFSVAELRARIRSLLEKRKLAPSSRRRTSTWRSSTSIWCSRSGRSSWRRWRRSRSPSRRRTRTRTDTPAACRSSPSASRASWGSPRPSARRSASPASSMTSARSGRPSRCSRSRARSRRGVRRLQAAQPDGLAHRLGGEASSRRSRGAILHHHERFDGAGYPEGIAGVDIPVLSRILAVCDTYDAMTSDRPYRAGVEHRPPWTRSCAAAGPSSIPSACRRSCASTRPAPPSPGFPSGLKSSPGSTRSSGGLSGHSAPSAAQRGRRAGTNIPTRAAYARYASASGLAGERRAPRRARRASISMPDRDGRRSQASRRATSPPEEREHVARVERVADERVRAAGLDVLGRGRREGERERARPVHPRRPREQRERRDEDSAVAPRRASDTGRSAGSRTPRTGAPPPRRARRGSGGAARAPEDAPHPDEEDGRTVPSTARAAAKRRSVTRASPARR